MHVLFKRAALAVCVVGLVWSAAETVRAANFAFSPTALELTAKQRSGVVTLQNSGDKPLRFEVTAMRWEQRADGQMDLQPTEDLLVYPPLITIAPSTASKFRVAAMVAPGEREKTYRIQVTEIPQFQGPSQSGPAIVIRSQLELAVFLAPTGAPQAVAAIVNSSVRAGAFAFSIANSGNIRVRVSSVAVTGLGNGGRTLFQKPLGGSYVLAGGQRDYVLALPRDHCAELRAISVDAVAVAAPHLSQTLEVPADPCHV